MSAIKPTLEELLKYQSIPLIIRKGEAAAIVGDFDYIDNVIIPAYMKVPFLPGVTERTDLTQIYDLPLRLLNNDDSKVRDYAATLLGAYFNMSTPGLDKFPGRDSVETLDILVGDLLHVALDDKELWPRFRASMALLHAHEYCQAPKCVKAIEIFYEDLKKNLEKGILKDKTLKEKTQPYLDYIAGKAKMLPFTP